MVMVFYVETQGNKITGKGIAVGVCKNQQEVTKQIFDALSNLPASFIADAEGNIISVVPDPIPEPEPPAPTIEERLIAAEQENQALKQAIAELQEKLKQQNINWQPQYEIKEK
jgi:vacuolar-type H+-ATPase subunit I/STV1